MEEKTDKQPTRSRNLPVFTALFWALLSISLTTANASDAPFAVGSTTVFIHDETRSFDMVAGVDQGIRTLVTEIWYPVEHNAVPAEARRATYGDYVFGDRAVHRKMMTATTFFHLTPDTVRAGVSQDQIDAAIDELFSRQRGSYLDLPMKRSGGPLPVVLMSPGDAGSRYNMETACEYLAAHGYLVVAPEHTGNSPYAQVGRDPLLEQEHHAPRYEQHRNLIEQITDHHGIYGTRANYGQSYTPLDDDRNPVTAIQKLDDALVERVNDLRATLRWLEARNASGLWENRLKLDEVGLMGRSLGGATVLAALGLEPRFTAGMAVVPPAWPDLRASLPEAALVKEQESVLLAAVGPYPLGELTKPTLVLNAAEDALIIGLSAERARAVGTPAPTAANAHPLLQAAFEQTAVPAVLALLADANHGSLATSGPYWWPALKPNEFERTFAPTEYYRLIDPEEAHRIQKRLALAFFDRFQRDMKAADKRLKKNSWSDDSLRLETRNF